ncbi:MAG: hypothetical protein AAB966_03545, partial [Patescibacteria group bacterium]
MAEASETIGSAIKQTIHDKPELGKPAVKTFLDNLQTASIEIDFPLEEQVGESIAFALLNREAPLEQRRTSMQTAITSAKDTVLNRFLPKIGVDGITISTKAQEASTHIADSIIETAEAYPKKPEKRDLFQEMFRIFNPSQPTPEDSAVSICVAFDLVDRLLEFDVYDPEKLKIQMQQVKRDVSLIKKFYASTAHAIELAADGTSSIPMEELIERMFQIGPIFA